MVCVAFSLLSVCSYKICKEQAQIAKVQTASVSLPLSDYQVTGARKQVEEGRQFDCLLCENEAFPEKLHAFAQSGWASKKDIEGRWGPIHSLWQCSCRYACLQTLRLEEGVG